MSSYMSLTTRADVWSWGAILYRMTYAVPPDYNRLSRPPSFNPNASSDPLLLDVLHHTLVTDPWKRADVRWLAIHPYTNTL